MPPAGSEALRKPAHSTQPQSPHLEDGDSYTSYRSIHLITCKVPKTPPAGLAHYPQYYHHHSDLPHVGCPVASSGMPVWGPWASPCMGQIVVVGDDVLNYQYSKIDLYHLWLGWATVPACPGLGKFWGRRAFSVKTRKASGKLGWAGHSAYSQTRPFFCAPGKDKALHCTKQGGLGLSAFGNRGHTRHDGSLLLSARSWHRDRMTFGKVDWIFFSLLSLSFLPSHQWLPWAQEKDNNGKKSEKALPCFRNQHFRFASTGALGLKSWRHEGLSLCNIFDEQ